MGQDYMHDFQGHLFIQLLGDLLTGLVTRSSVLLSPSVPVQSSQLSSAPFLSPSLK